MPNTKSERRERSEFDIVWDAGELSCGELVLELRSRLAAIPGRMIRLIALDPGAPEDIPSWCRLTGNVLVRREEATSSYWIRAKGQHTSQEEGASLDASSFDENEIYSPKIFELAKSLPEASRLAQPHATARAVSKVCGSTIEIDVAVSADMLSAYAHRVKACLFGRAAAAVVAHNIIGTSAPEVLHIAAVMRTMLDAGGPPPDGKWADLSALAPMRVLKARHGSVLLVFEALERALAKLPAQR